MDVPTAKYVERVYSCASDAQLFTEVSQATFGRFAVPYSVLLGKARKLLRKAVPVVQPPLSFSLSVRVKKVAKSTGSPTCFVYGIYLQLLSHIACVELTSADQPEAQEALECCSVVLAALEGWILIGHTFEHAYMAVAKNDFHTPKKILAERMRSLSCPHVWAVLLMARWFSSVDAQYKLSSKRVYAYTFPEAYEERVGVARWHSSFGADITGFDKDIPVDVNLAIFSALVERTTLHSVRGGEFLIQFFFSCVVTPTVVCPGGYVFFLAGSNSSGQLLTTFWNCLTHEIIFEIVEDLRLAQRVSPLPKALSWTEQVLCDAPVLRLLEPDLVGPLETVIDGDDSIYYQLVEGGSLCSVASYFQTAYSVLFGFRLKVDLLDGTSPFPPGCQPPFLGLVEHFGWARGGFVRIPSEPCRRILSSAWSSGFETPGLTGTIEGYKRTLFGLVESINSVRIANMVGLPLPDPYKALLETCAQFSVQLPPLEGFRELYWDQWVGKWL